MNTRAILIGLALGLGLGIAASATGSPALLWAAEAVEPLGQVFLRAIQMVVIPLVASVVFVGVARIWSLRKLGRWSRRSTWWACRSQGSAFCWGSTACRTCSDPRPT